MKTAFYIFFSALLLRLINLLFHDLNLSSYIYEDQYMYWDWSVKGAYTNWSQISKEILTERMPGVFWFYEVLIWIFGANLFFVIFCQCIVDSFTCVIIAKSAKLIDRNLENTVAFLSIISPTMIISSSQILSDTLFLLFFSLSIYFFLKLYYFSPTLYSAASGIMLGLSSLVRAASFPLIFLCVPILVIINLFKGRSIHKIIICIFLFFLLGFMPITHRLLNNIKEYNTVSLTSQTGSHLSYFVVPNMLNISKGYDRKKSLDLINEKIASKGPLTDNPYKNSNIRVSAALEIISEQSVWHVMYSWGKASVFNIFTPAFLIDQRVRELPHPSFVNSSGIIDWISSIFKNKEFFNYFCIIFVSVIFSIIITILIIFGFMIYLFKNFYFTIISSFLILYFILITGPNISPKYILPFISVIFLWQAEAIQYFLNFYKTHAKRFI